MILPPMNIFSSGLVPPNMVSAYQPLDVLADANSLPVDRPRLLASKLYSIVNDLRIGRLAASSDPDYARLAHKCMAITPDSTRKRWTRQAELAEAARHG